QMSRDGQRLRITPCAIGSEIIVVREIVTGRIVVQYLLNVNDPALLVIQSQIHNSLSGIEGIATKIAAKRVLIDGEVLTAAEVARVHDVAKLYGDHVRSLVTLRPDADHKLAQIIEREIGNAEI